MSKFYDSYGDGEQTTPIVMRFTSSPSSASVAKQLYSTGQRSSRRTSFGSDPELMSISDSEFQPEISTLSNTITSLNQRLSDMESMHQATNNEKNRLERDYAIEVERNSVLEEKLHQTEEKLEDKVKELKRNHQEAISRNEREKQLELESCGLKYEMLKKDAESYAKEKARYEIEIKKYLNTISEMKEKFEDAKEAYQNAEQEKKETLRQFDLYKRDIQADMYSNTELVEQLNRETEELRQRGVGRQGSVSYQISALEEENIELRNENRRLQKASEDLHNEMLADSVNKGQLLLAGNLSSLADELTGNGSADKDWKSGYLQMEIETRHLKEYINNILVRVIELHPEILEIKEEDLPSNNNKKSSNSSST
uniref:FIP-RBD domain-containing protein n=1 Tax=Rhabditophanes sp. KR3021 TaxID=114890 RepID=A0AC35U5J7_9BILA